MSTARLPSAAPLERYERARALLSVEAFLAALPGDAVLVRLDERGGPDEPAPWAFPETTGPSDDDLLSAVAGTDEATSPFVGPPPLPTPKSREMASVLVVPGDGGQLGRRAEAPLRVLERSVSRRHARINKDRSIIDEGSSNGTFVNGMLLPVGGARRLTSGDVLGLGDVEFVFLSALDFFHKLPRLVGDSE